MAHTQNTATFKEVYPSDHNSAQSRCTTTGSPYIEVMLDGAGIDSVASATVRWWADNYNKDTYRYQDGGAKCPSLKLGATTQPVCRTAKYDEQFVGPMKVEYVVSAASIGSSANNKGANGRHPGTLDTLTATTATFVSDTPLPHPGVLSHRWTTGVVGGSGVRPIIRQGVVYTVEVSVVAGGSAAGAMGFFAHSVGDSAGNSLLAVSFAQDAATVIKLYGPSVSVDDEGVIYFCTNYMQTDSVYGNTVHAMSFTLDTQLAQKVLLSPADLVPAPAEPGTGFFLETFSGKGGLDAGKWLVAKKQWGGVGKNGGVVPENVHFPGDGTVVLRANGDLYTGPVRGVEKKDNTWVDLQHGRRTGAAIATKEYFASGVYEVRMKVAPVKGVCSAVWTFYYEEVYPPGEPVQVVNHEIDIELPGRPGEALTNISHTALLGNTWVGEKVSEHNVGYTTDLPAQDDGEYHVYKFVWHTGDVSKQQNKRVDFYVDGNKVSSSTDHVPTRAGRFWVGARFPNNWARDPNFDTADMVVDYVKVTPLNEAGDERVPETYPGMGWGSLDDTNTIKADSKDDWAAVFPSKALGTTDKPYGHATEVAGGIIYVCGMRTLHAFNTSNGDIVFSHAIKAPITQAKPRVAAGQVYFTDMAGFVHALDAATGSTVFSVSVGVGNTALSRPFVSSGVLYVVCDDEDATARVHALDVLSGARMFTSSGSAGQHLPPFKQLYPAKSCSKAAAPRSNPLLPRPLIATATDTTAAECLALCTATTFNMISHVLVQNDPGCTFVEHDPDSRLCSLYRSCDFQRSDRPAKENSGGITVTEFNGNLHASTARPPSRVPGVVVANGVLYFGVERKLFGVDAKTGSSVVEFLSGGIVSSTPATAGGIVYFGGDDCVLYAVNTTGARVFAFDGNTAAYPDTRLVPSACTMHSPMVLDGRVYVASRHLHTHGRSWVLNASGGGYAAQATTTTMAPLSMAAASTTHCWKSAYTVRTLKGEDVCLHECSTGAWAAGCDVASTCNASLIQAYGGCPCWDGCLGQVASKGLLDITRARLKDAQPLAIQRDATAVRFHP